ncbi:hypothetical protein EV401DRAFT_1893297 [Pisolithus croceorrhizus]|nr:hypothetical protein EV401DRAFT_1893297 [Pisolithus croceorrhizus]
MSSPYTTHLNDMGIPGGFGEDFSLTNADRFAALICSHRMCPHRGFDLCYTYLYYMTYCSEDASIVKSLVAATCYRVQSLQITNYGVPTSLEYIVWSFPSLVIIVVQLEVVGDSPDRFAMGLCCSSAMWDLF